jgi:hypothetical protein
MGSLTVRSGMCQPNGQLNAVSKGDLGKGLAPGKVRS